MSYEEDYLLGKVAELERRLAVLEAAAAPAPAAKPKVSRAATDKADD